jgi:hypothetical protein
VKVTLTSANALSAAWDAARFLAPGQQGAADTATGAAGLLPDGVRDWLASLRLLEGVPFQHLVADDRLLPQESVRFFYLDRNWTDALIAGALSVGTVTAADRAQLQALYPRLRAELDAAERLARVPGNETAADGPADVVTGLLIRSRAVSGWPALHLRAYRAEVPDDGPDDGSQRLHLMRLERLAPGVLLALFDGVPAVVHLEEPRAGLQFGFLPDNQQSPDGTAYQLPLRDPATGADLVAASPTGGQDSITVPVPFRPDAPGVIDLAALQTAIVTRLGQALGQPQPLGGAEFALQALRFPYRQVFGPSEADPPFDDLFRPQVGIETIRAWPGYAPQATDQHMTAEQPAEGQRPDDAEGAP